MEDQAKAQLDNIQAAMAAQLSQFRANASQEGSLYGDVMGERHGAARHVARVLKPLWSPPRRLLPRRRLE